MAVAEVTRRARWFMLASVVFLVAWQGAALAGLQRRTIVVLGLYGFVLHTLFGKALSLLPSYFDRQLSVRWAPAVQFPLTTLGVVLMAASGMIGVAPVFAQVGGVLWFFGVLLFLGAIAWTIRDNPLGSETATSEANAERRPVDRYANLFMPIALAYLLYGSYETMAGPLGLPTVIGAYQPRTTHLLAAGTAALLLFAIGFRLLPRFLVAYPPRWLVWIVLPTGALGPVVVGATLPAGPVFAIGAVIEATAVIGFALAYVVLFARSDRRRVGFYAVLAGVIAGSVGVGLGLMFGLGYYEASLIQAHYRLNLLGFLGLGVIGVSYQFYPPGVATFTGGGDRTAYAAIGLLAGGLGLEVIGLIADLPPVETLGLMVAMVGAVIHAGLLAGLFYQRYG